MASMNTGSQLDYGFLVALKKWWQSQVGFHNFPRPALISKDMGSAQQHFRKITLTEFLMIIRLST